MVVSYVKFLRCTRAYYNRLATKDQDTLYFVYEKANADTGFLYLGNKLIIGNADFNPDSNGISISQAADVIIKQGLSDGDILLYNEATRKWENHSLQDLLEYSIMKGATSTEDGLVGLVPKPNAGDQLKFLSGDGTWKIPYDSDLHAKVRTLIDLDDGLSAREIAKDVVFTIEQTVLKLQNELDGITGGQPGGNLNERIQTLENTVGNFTPVETRYLTIGDAINYFDESITSISDRLKWHAMSEDYQ